MNILVVEDEPKIGEYLKKGLLSLDILLLSPQMESMADFTHLAMNLT